MLRVLFGRKLFCLRRAAASVVFFILLFTFFAIKSSFGLIRTEREGERRGKGERERKRERERG